MTAMGRTADFSSRAGAQSERFGGVDGYTPHEITTACSHRREEVDLRDPHFHPPP